ncbi:hypothetical protein QFC24_000126 [Naganishia onofrii]|uniref:Uncharacterized protein n=1 Tax=Naganishia onofrii TaxID=1851511 RepID=A0ACC2XX19_9TREE|nr:hypothetical protein QFC24_000126 [Naganishia onofrii]
MHPGTVTQPVGSVGEVHLELGVGIALETTDDTTEEICKGIDRVVGIALEESRVLLETAKPDDTPEEVEATEEDARDDDEILEALELEAIALEALALDAIELEVIELEAIGLDATELGAIEPEIELDDVELLEADLVDETAAELLLAEGAAEELAVELDAAGVELWKEEAKNASYGKLILWVSGCGDVHTATELDEAFEEDAIAGD